MSTGVSLGAFAGTSDIADPNSVNRISCHSTLAASDLQLNVVRIGDKKFKTSYSMTRPFKTISQFPSSIHWSGHFWIFSDGKFPSTNPYSVTFRTRSADANDGSIYFTVGTTNQTTIQSLSCEMNP